MRLNRIILLAAVALLASTDATATFTNTERNKLSAHRPAVDEQYTSANRSLRVGKKNDNAGSAEERNTGTALSTKVAGALNSADATGTFSLASLVDKAKKKLVYLIRTPADKKIALQLDDHPLRIIDLPNFSEWLKWTRQYNLDKGLPEVSSISEVLKTIPAYRLDEILTKFPGLDDLQCMYWIQKNMTPDDVKIWLGATSSDNPNLKYLEKFTAMFNEQHTTQYCLDSKKTPDQVKAILGLDNLSEKMIDGPNLGVWIQFTRTYHVQPYLYRSELSSFSDVLERIPRNRVAEVMTKYPDIDDVLYKYWLQKKVNPGEVMNVLTEDPKMKGISVMESWLRYKNLYKLQYPKKVETPLNRRDTKEYYNVKN